MYPPRLAWSIGLSLAACVPFAAQPLPKEDAASDAGVAADAGVPAEGSGSEASTMIPIDGFSIDAREVTVAEFEAFRSDVGTAVPSNEKCPEKTAWGPDPACELRNSGDLPIHCVDYCDAVAYCAWAGKRLCGGRGGGPVSVDAADEVRSSQWTRACAGPSSGARWSFGGEPMADACNTSDLGEGGLLVTGALPRCEGDAPGLYDMIGNAIEWEDSCEQQSGEWFCLLRGGSFKHRLEAQRCDDAIFGNAASAFTDSGFRCCKDDP